MGGVYHIQFFWDFYIFFIFTRPLRPTTIYLDLVITQPTTSVTNGKTNNVIGVKCRTDLPIP